MTGLQFGPRHPQDEHGSPTHGAVLDYWNDLHHLQGTSISEHNLQSQEFVSFCTMGWVC